MSKLFYKLKSARDFSSLTFDTPTITVFDAKREIMIATKMGKGVDFGLHLYEAGTMEEYTDDSVHIPRNHSVIVRRFPAKAAGKGTAYKYLLGLNQTSAATSVQPTYTGPMSLNLAAASAAQLATRQVDLEKETEEERTARILQEGKHSYTKKAEELEHSEPRVWSNKGTKSTGTARPFVQYDKRKQPERGPPPPQYVCFRCCESGHWIQDCPTNGHKEFDRAPKIKRTTGIPRSFLKVVDSPDELRASGRGVMVTQDGSVVVAQANDEAWAALHGRHPRQAAVTNAPGTSCPLCAQTLTEPRKLPCCNNIFCDECIRNHLLEQMESNGVMKCPICDAHASPDILIVVTEQDGAYVEKSKPVISNKENEVEPQGDCIVTYPIEASLDEPNYTQYKSDARSKDEKPDVSHMADGNAAIILEQNPAVDNYGGVRPQAEYQAEYPPPHQQQPSFNPKHGIVRSDANSIPVNWSRGTSVQHAHPQISREVANERNAEYSSNAYSSLGNQYMRHSEPQAGRFRDVSSSNQEFVAPDYINSHHRTHDDGARNVVNYMVGRGDTPKESYPGRRGSLSSSGVDRSQRIQDDASSKPKRPALPPPPSRREEQREEDARGNLKHPQPDWPLRSQQNLRQRQSSVTPGAPPPSRHEESRMKDVHRAVDAKQRNHVDHSASKRDNERNDVLRSTPTTIFAQHDKLPSNHSSREPIPSWNRTNADSNKDSIAQRSYRSFDDSNVSGHTQTIQRSIFRNINSDHLPDLPPPRRKESLTSDGGRHKRSRSPFSDRDATNHAFSNRSSDKRRLDHRQERPYDSKQMQNHSRVDSETAVRMQHDSSNQHADERSRDQSQNHDNAARDIVEYVTQREHRKPASKSPSIDHQRQLRGADTEDSLPYGRVSRSRDHEHRRGHKVQTYRTHNNAELDAEPTEEELDIERSRTVR